MSRTRPRLVALLRDVVPTAAIAVAVFIALRARVADRYPVAGPSMEPTLHGDPDTGDIVVVDKTAWWSRMPGRFDLAVVRHPEEEGRNLVKRVIGLSDERLRIRAGDVFVAAGGGGFERIVKEPGAHPDLRQPWYVYPPPAPTPPDERPDRRLHGFAGLTEPAPGAGGDRGARTLLPGAADLAGLRALLAPPAARERLQRVPPVHHLPGHLGTEQEVETSFLDVRGKRTGDRGIPVRDAGMEVVLVPGAELQGLQLAWEHRRRIFAWSYAAGGHLAFGEGDRAADAGRGPELVPGRRRVLSFGHLDGHAFLTVDGELVHHTALPSLEPAEVSLLTRDGPANLVQLAAAGGTCELHRLEVFHDIHYVPGIVRTRESTVWHVPTEALFLLGDNSFESEDSRTGRFFTRADLVGRPLLVVGPPGRWRWLGAP